MTNVKHESDYDPELNIVYTKLINKPKTIEDVEIGVRENERLLQQGGKNKVWSIMDISEMGMAPPKLIKAYQELDKPIVDKYVIGYCTVCANAFERIAAQLFTVLRGEKLNIFKTRQEATDWILKEQETRGRFQPL